MSSSQKIHFRLLKFRLQSNFRLILSPSLDDDVNPGYQWESSSSLIARWGGVGCRRVALKRGTPFEADSYLDVKNIIKNHCFLLESTFQVIAGWCYKVALKRGTPPKVNCCKYSAV